MNKGKIDQFLCYLFHLINDNKLVSDNTEAANNLKLHFETSVISIVITKNKHLTETDNIWKTQSNYQ